MSNRVSICNDALGRIGANSISSLEDNTTDARRCKLIYDQSRRALFRMHPWTCATKRVVLSPEVIKPAFGFSYSFPLPHDFIRLLSAGEQHFMIENRHVLANQSKINFIYIFDNDNEQTWDALLVEAMGLYLASKLAKPVTGSSTEADRSWQELQHLLKQARAINGQEYPSQDFGSYMDESFLRARY